MERKEIDMEITMKCPCGKTLTSTGDAVGMKTTVTEWIDSHGRHGTAGRTEPEAVEPHRDDERTECEHFAAPNFCTHINDVVQ